MLIYKNSEQGNWYSTTHEQKKYYALASFSQLHHPALGVVPHIYHPRLPSSCLTCAIPSSSSPELGLILHPLSYTLTYVRVCLWPLGHQLGTMHEQTTSHTCWCVPLHLICICLCVQANFLHPLTWIGSGIPQRGAHVVCLEHMSTHCAPATPSTCTSAAWRPRRASIHIVHVLCSCIRRSCILGCLGGGRSWPIVVRWLGSCRHKWREGDGGGASSLLGFGGIGVIILKSILTWHTRMDGWHDMSAILRWHCWHR